MNICETASELKIYFRFYRLLLSLITIAIYVHDEHGIFTDESEIFTDK